MYTHYIGFDLHKNYSLATAMNEKGEINNQQVKLPNRGQNILNFLEPFPRPKIAVEAGSNWYWFIDLLQDHNYDVVLSHPKKTKAIASAKIMTDKISSETLTHLLRTNLLPTSYILPRQLRQTRDLLRHRVALVTIRTSLKNRIHAILRNFNFHCPFTDLFGKSGRAWLKQVPLKENYRLFIDNFLSLIDTIEPKIKELDKMIKEIAQENPQATLLDEIPGIDYYSALLIAMEIGDIRRFPDHRHLCSYIGIVPSTHRSGNIDYTGSITKEGNRWLRWIINEAAQKAEVSLHNPYRRLYRKISEKKGPAKARIAVARKIATAIYYMLSKNEGFKLPKSLKGRSIKVG
jgi:transposase